MTERHKTTRIRRERRRRQLTVTERVELSPHMIRLTFTSPDLADFESQGADDHIKLFFADAEGGRAMRDYTPRAFDIEAQTLSIDFAIHDAGPATAWALKAQPGDTLSIGGPQGSTVIADDFDWYLLIGDETALPSIGRRLEELRPGVPVFVVASVDAPEDRFPLPAREGLAEYWTFRSEGGDEADRIVAVLEGLTLPDGEGYVWIAAEATVARAVRFHVIEAMGHPREWTKAGGYWIAGESGSEKRIDD
ncbi:siderophore-interacting protein [Stakelama sp. CBK3Z-3]|uniref:Siderophore-interacting protein n=1 Tax=Stakelama flava TaxID=2860338 RepID=A0ABS6XRR1_9SPHN|nr:siderophore-interacting protein [Stakelama flava]MBW4332115.1 siderophore-interacting protein [Stakelama flava]